MSYLRTSLLLAIGIFGVGLGTAGGCASGTSSLPTHPNNLGGSGSSTSSGGLTSILPPMAGDSYGGTAAGGSTTIVVPCDTGLKRCGPTCIDVATNSLHCGDCGKPCPAEARECVDGSCVCPPATHGVCDGICADLRSDLSNCGTCGNICAADRVCTEGVCVCDPSKAAHTPCGTKCVDLLTDVFHCGTCNETTTPACDAAQVCNQGVCDSACTAPIVKCGAKCADLQKDSANCSECGKACDATRMCSAATCVCATGRTLCGTACADTKTDSKNCGACGTVCAPGTECKAGKCACTTDATLCTVPGTGGAGGAGAKSTVVCVDPTQHHEHCGACNSPCTAMEVCQDSACACVAPAVTCGTPAVCTDLQTSNAHCGGCGKACAAATEHCEAGACVCTAPLADCGSGCVDISKTAAHCGECNKPCTGNQLCSNSVCVSGDIRVSTKMQSLPATVTTKTNSVTLSVRVCNIGTSSASLKGATIKYWYSIDGAGGTQVANAPYSSLAGVTVEAVAVDPMRGTTDYVLVATLPATASLAAGACFDEIQMAVHAGTTWVTGYEPANDWSYLAQTAFTLNDKVTMYMGTAKMWGTEPPL